MSMLLTLPARMFAVARLSLLTIPQRLGTSLVIVVGIAGVVAMLVAMLAMADGFRQTLSRTGHAERIIVVRGGSDNELASGLSREQADIVLQSAGLRRDDAGLPLASPELYFLAELRTRGERNPSNVPVRAVSDLAFAVRPEWRLVEGRRFRPGTREVMIGRGAAGQFEQTALGDWLPIRDGDWQVVGIFSTGGDVHESELWVDAPLVQAILKRSGVSSVTAVLDSATDFDDFAARLTSDPRLTVKVQRQNEYYAGQSAALTAFIKGLGYTITAIMAIGAIFAALNTMYSAVAARRVEIATLRALGFGGGAVAGGVLLEALLLAALGALAGMAVAWLAFNGMTVSTLNFQTFSQVAFAFRVTPGALLQGAVGALAIGLFGGLLPAWRAARAPLTGALRSG